MRQFHFSSRLFAELSAIDLDSCGTEATPFPTLPVESDLIRAMVSAHRGKRAGIGTMGRFMRHMIVYIAGPDSS